jgi:hypothetical protein
VRSLAGPPIRCGLACSIGRPSPPTTPTEPHRVDHAERALGQAGALGGEGLPGPCRSVRRCYDKNRGLKMELPEVRTCSYKLR